LGRLPETTLAAHALRAHIDGQRRSPAMTETSDLPQTEAQWREKLGPTRYHILREGGTERAFTGEYESNKAAGDYLCGGCGAPLFHSSTKYNSGSGWPSFYAPEDASAIAELRDMSHGMVRVEVRCTRCEGHLGHVFPDGPQPTGLRYCINSASLNFVPEDLPGEDA
jgi:peptide-methionine (R)-S-oxide reductase